MIEKLVPPTMAKPASAYAHGAVIPAGARTLHVSGQLRQSAGRAVDGGLVKNSCEVCES